MGGADFDIAPAIEKWAPGEKHTVKLPLSCFVARGADLGGVAVPFSVAADAPFAASFTSIKIVAGAGADPDARGSGPNGESSACGHGLSRERSAGHPGER